MNSNVRLRKVAAKASRYRLSKFILNKIGKKPQKQNSKKAERKTT
jgi:hypothetical protein